MELKLFENLLFVKYELLVCYMNYQGYVVEKFKIKLN